MANRPASAQPQTVSQHRGPSTVWQERPSSILTCVISPPAGHPRAALLVYGRRMVQAPSSLDRLAASERIAKDWVEGLRMGDPVHRMAKHLGPSVGVFASSQLSPAWMDRPRGAERPFRGSDPFGKVREWLVNPSADPITCTFRSRSALSITLPYWWRRRSSALKGRFHDSEA